MAIEADNTYVSNCKINLFLNILGKTTNGYHELESLIAFTDLMDFITISKSDNKTNVKFTYKITVAEEINPLENTITKAIDALNEVCNKNICLNVNVTKNIPIGAGLGGGSANAATVIRAALELYDIQLTPEQKKTVAEKVGMDTVVCLENKASIVRDLGNVIHCTVNPFMSHDLIIIYPNIQLSTPTVYGTFKGPFGKSLITDKTDIKTYIQDTHNSLLESAISHAPEIQDIIFTTSQQSGCIKTDMSGSGSACFGIFASSQYASDAYTNLTKIFPEYFIHKGLMLHTNNFDCINKSLRVELIH